MIREMFAYAKEHEPCIIFMDEIDAIGGRRFSEGTSADREIQRTLMEVGLSSLLLLLLPFPSCLSLPPILFHNPSSSDRVPQPETGYLDATLTTAPEPNGWIRLPGQNKVNHGNKQTGHPRSRPPPSRST